MRLSFQAAGRLLAAVAALTLAASAQAATYRWSFSNLTFSDGAKAYGSFYSNGTSFFNWDITSYWDPAMPGQPEMVSPYHYTSATSTLEAGSSFRLLRNDTPVPGNYLELSFSQRLNHAGRVFGGALEQTESFGGSITSHSGSFVARSIGGPVRPARGLGRFPAALASGAEDPEGLAVFSGEEVLVSAPVPEPQTYAMALVGLMLVGAAVRRRVSSRG